MGAALMKGRALLSLCILLSLEIPFQMLIPSCLGMNLSQEKCCQWSGMANLELVSGNEGLT